MGLTVGNCSRTIAAMPKKIRPGERVRRWRLSQEPKITQAALGEQIGLSGDAIRHFENTGKTIALPSKVALCRVMECPLDWILENDELIVAREIHRLLDEDAHSGGAAA